MAQHAGIIILSLHWIRGTVYDISTTKLQLQNSLESKETQIHNVLSQTDELVTGNYEQFEKHGRLFFFPEQ